MSVDTFKIWLYIAVVLFVKCQEIVRKKNLDQMKQGVILKGKLKERETFLLSDSPEINKYIKHIDFFAPKLSTEKSVRLECIRILFTSVLLKQSRF